MTSRNHFTPFIVDDPGPDQREAMLFEGEGKRRQEFRPSRFVIGFVIIVAVFSLFGAAALAGQKIAELETRYGSEART